ncbi:hypothetical protein KY363_02110 [Candidatus Woesearchaeota archaeon]|nr:hypothetical protein [Candidatus Woesearchaeota archaeon]
MGFIQELADIISKLNFFQIVYEYEQGLYFRNGIVKQKRIRRTAAELEEIVQEEEALMEKMGGSREFTRPFRRPKLPEGYMRSFWTGKPLHPKRFQKGKVLRPGLYFHIPVIDDIRKDYSQEKVLNLGNINIPTNEDKSRVVLLSCNIRYQLENFYKAYTAVYCYETSLKDYALAMLAKQSRGKRYDDWKNPQVIKQVEEEMACELREVVTEKWGLSIHRVYITDNADSNVQRVLHEGPPLVVNSTVPEDSGGILRSS